MVPDMHHTTGVVFFPKAKPDTVAGEPGQWSPRVSVSNQPLTLTSEFGYGVNPEARLSRFVSVYRNPTPTSTGGTLRAVKSNQSRNLLQQIDAIRGTLFLNYLEFRMIGSTPDPTTPDQSPSLYHVSSLETLNKQHNEKSGTLVTPIRLTFEEEADSNKGKYNEKGATKGVDDNLKKSYKEVLESPFTRRIIEFSAPSHRMPTNLRVLDGSTDPDDHISRFVGDANQGEWEMPGEQSERGQGTPYKGFRSPRAMQGVGPPRADDYNTYRSDHYQPPKEILFTELQLQLSPPPSLVETPKRENLDRYCDYHGEKGHYTNDCFQLKKQLEIALKSKKLNHLFKDVRQRGGNRGKQVGNSSNNDKIINMVYEMGDAHKHKFQKRREKDWMNAPITFPSIPSDDVSDEPLIIEAEVEGYLVRRVFVDQGAAVQVMFEHCLRNLCPTIQARLTRTHTELVSFSGEQLLPIGKIELEVMFGSEGLSRRTMMKFTVVQASSPYNIILGRTGIRELRAILSTTHAMMKFLTSRWIATLRLVDSAFQTQLGRNLEAYVDDMITKSRTDRDIIMDVAETFNNLRKVNMKLNLRKCSFGVNEGKFLRYMVTSEGIRANPKKKKVVADMQSPKTLKEMKSLSEKLAALNRFLS
uniref:Reverse transcriptase domain-containing protein n=1 Tax=Tanacetum cinerariifolium TaxID=118510 RepID=A0A699GUS4_TANCI|nr:reverse transcriptase domain-containing protein [Tanacetum cinerariifolium]